ncbi:dihydroxyacetone phosphate acyltransferase isoform X2 [Oncorhynchus tshawytscha]|uniref:Phospholipid/glycerol acyltransferase domain-containing protein n=1 Tax=Oncorhynchus tshawytscha TaxID=74940 RepID=A0A8C8ISY1_ONCTS|nr:dihydroxyacetone phosphate acyltransferase isoform X2 [Oncorhynchus tshawytscha]
MTTCEDPSGYKQEDEFMDILEERRRSSDLGHALRTFTPSPYRGAPPLSAGALNRMVLESQYLRYVTKEVAMETGESVDLVREEASGILDEMSQNLQLGFIRLLGFTLSKVFKRLFSHININQEGLNRLQQAIQESPVILMPNHRSYVDFLVLSYILFTYDLPIPVIAAGIPLMDMKMVGEILRRSGAFFIRRAIGSDKLYWAVLSEYVKTIVRTGYAPVEFYVEGLRSRTLKSLTPKLGMMHMVLEPFFKGEVYDITLVPISISYDRVLEESLLAHELLGVPKPRETTMGLLKARRVLEDDYGSMHVYFGMPLSVRQLTKGRVDRCEYNLLPRDLPQRPSVETQECVSWLAQQVIRVQEQSSILSPWSLMACLVLQDHQNTDPGEEQEKGLSWELLTQRTLWLKGLAISFGARLDWPEQPPENQVMASSMALHSSVIRCHQGRVTLLEEEGPVGAGPFTTEEGVVRRARAVLMVAAYRNQALHVFIRPAMVALAIHTTRSSQREDIYSYFRFLLDLFSNDFIFITGRSSQDFEEACSLLRKCGAVQTSQQEVTSPEEGQRTTSFLRALLQPFIDAYQVVFSHLCLEDVEVFTERQMVPAVRSLATKLLLSGELTSCDALSSDTQKNVLSALLRLGAVTRLRTAEHSEFRANKPAISRLADTLAGRLPVQTAPNPRL